MLQMPAYPTPIHLWRHPKTGYFYLVWRQDGQPRRRSTRTKKRAEAETLLRAALRRHFDGWGRHAGLALTLHDGALEWLADRERPSRQLQESTLSGYRIAVRQLLELTPASLPAAEVGPRDVRMILDRWQEARGLSPSGLAHKMSILSMIFRWLVRQDLVHRNPCDAVERPRARPVHFRPVTADEYQALRRALLADLDGARGDAHRRNVQMLLDYVTVIWLSGMRTVQARRLRWEDVDLEAMVWILRSPENKGGTRALPIHRDLRELLLRRQMLGQEGPFVPERHVRRTWYKWKMRHPGLADVHLHGMRARMVTELKRMRELEAAKGLVGHSTDAISDLYTHLGAEDFREALDRIR